MPRTKKPVSNLNEKENMETTINTNFSARIEKKLADLIADINERRDTALAQVDRDEKNLRVIFKRDLHKTMEQMRNTCDASNIDSLNYDQYSCDEGYLTTESSDLTTKTSKVTFNTTSLSNTTTNMGNMSAFKTPMCSFMSKEAALAAGYITPKVKPNRPLTVLRQANPGEMVVSMTGSPVLVQSVDVQKPNVNVPLGNGRVISVQPQNSIRRSEIPEIDETTRNYLLTLRDNLDQIVKYG